MAPHDAHIEILIDTLETAIRLRQSGQTEKAREHLSNLFENQFSEEKHVCTADETDLYACLHVEAGMCATLLADADDALQHFRQASPTHPLSAEASLLFARALLSTGDVENIANAQKKLNDLLCFDVPAPRGLTSEIGVMSCFLLAITALNQDNLLLATSYLDRLTNTLRSNDALSLAFTEQLGYFITEREISVLPKIFPQLNTLLGLKVIDEKLPGLYMFFSPSSRSPSFSSFLDEGTSPSASSFFPRW